MSKKGRSKLSKLRDQADAVFAHYIRLRDSELVGDKWVGQCVCCPAGPLLTSRYFDGEKWRWTKSTNVGHYYTRGKMALRYDEFNCNMQNTHCNAWKDKNTMQNDYKNGLLSKYGKLTLKELEDTYNSPDVGLTVGFLEQVIHDYTICLNDYLRDES